MKRAILAAGSLLILSGLSASCGSGPTRPASPLGCWRADAQPPSLGLFGLFLTRIDSSTVFLPELAGPDAPIRHIWNEIEGSDSVRIWTNGGGFGGVEVRAAIHGDTLLGYVRPWTDYKFDFEWEPFQAVRSDCPEGSSVDPGAHRVDLRGSRGESI